VSETVAEGADVVTFSGDKLLGGPQAGFIVGRKDLIAKINRNSMKRALRVDKIRLAALEATLQLYRDPERLTERLPTVRAIARPKKEIEALARRIVPALTEALGSAFAIDLVSCNSQIGSGALPQEQIASAGIAIRPKAAQGRRLASLAAALRALPVPVIGHTADGAIVLDLRCLEDEPGFVANLAPLGRGKLSDATA
jgi:L-seryl-tRNA(Ser) seleniumtransferase